MPRGTLLNQPIALMATLLLLTAGGRASAQDASQAKPDVISKGVEKKLRQAIALGEIRVALTPTNRQRLGWSPKGAKVQLKSEGQRRLTGAFRLHGHGPMLVQLQLPAKPGGDATLQFDADANGKLDAKETHPIKASLSRGKYWYSATATLQLPMGANKKRDYPISLWYVQDPEEATESVIRWSRRGWHEGTFDWFGKAAYAVVADRQMDGRFNRLDAWGLGQTPEEARSAQRSTASIAGHNWLDGVAFRIKSVDDDGRHLTLEAFDLGWSEAEDRKKRDPYAKDRNYARAKQPLKFTHDLESALAKAKGENKKVIVDFVTTWCGPCRVMDTLVYTAKPIVDRQDSAIFVKLDGDKDKQWVKRYQVRGYPTLLVLDPQGEVLKRAVGYQGVAKTLELLK